MWANHNEKENILAKSFAFDCWGKTTGVLTQSSLTGVLLQ